METAHQANEDLWTALPFAEATWRSTYQVRAITFANDIDPRVQEVLELPVLSLTTEQDVDPNLLFVKELLSDHERHVARVSKGYPPATRPKYNNSRHCLLCPLHASLTLDSYNSATTRSNNFI